MDGIVGEDFSIVFIALQYGSPKHSTTMLFCVFLFFNFVVQITDGQSNATSTARPTTRAVPTTLTSLTTVSTEISPISLTTNRVRLESLSQAPTLLPPVTQPAGTVFVL